MKDSKENQEDELRPNYDLKTLRVRKLGPGRKRFDSTTIEERRREIHENAEAGLEEYRRGELESFSNPDDLMDCLSHD